MPNFICSNFFIAFCLFFQNVEKKYFPNLNQKKEKDNLNIIFGENYLEFSSKFYKLNIRNIFAYIKDLKISVSVLHSKK